MYTKTKKIRAGIAGLALFLSGGVAGAAALYAYQELPFYDKVECASPLDTVPLVVRNDSRGKGAFGARRSGGRTHKGVDLSAPSGSPVYAIRSGWVLEAETHKGLGNYVKILHKDGVTSLYAHMESLEVSAGERIAQATVVGRVGKTGNAKHPAIDPHIHLQVAKDGEVVDPAGLGLIYKNPLEDS